MSYIGVATMASVRPHSTACAPSSGGALAALHRFFSSPERFLFHHSLQRVLSPGRECRVAQINLCMQAY
jgi:hypothetical protein